MGLKLIHISKRGNWWSNPLDITLVVLTINCLCKTFPDFAIKVLCFLTTINLTFKFQLMVHEKLSWRNCKCPVDLWQPGQIVLKKFHPSKNPGIHRSLVNSPHKGQWRGALMFSLICAWTNCWVNNRDAGNLKCHSAHYDVIVLYLSTVFDATWNLFMEVYF